MKRISLFAGLILVGELQMELPEGFRITNMTANGGDYIYGMADSSGIPYLMKWSADGHLLKRNLSEACCGYLCVTGEYLVLSEQATSRLTLFTTDLEYIREIILETKCLPPALTVEYKHVYPLEDGTLLVIGKYISGDTHSLASVWDTTGRFLRFFILPDSAWARFQPFATSFLFCQSNGDVVLAVDAFPFKFYVVSTKGKPELLDSFTVKIKKQKGFSAPEGEAGEEYEMFIKWLEEECTSNHPVFGGPAYRLSDGKILFSFSHCASVVNLNMSPGLGIYDPARKKVVWTRDWAGGVLGGIRGDTVILGQKAEVLGGKIWKAVVR